MSGEDEKTQVSSSTTPEADLKNGGCKADEKPEPIANGEGGDEVKDSKKATKRKAAPIKKVKEVSYEDQEEEESKKSPKKKKAPQPKKSPVKKAKQEDLGEEDEVESKKSKKPASPKKGNLKNDEGDKDDEEEMEAEEKPKKGVPLLDQPLEIEGSRARKTVARFTFNNVEKDDKKPFTVPEGSGVRLGEVSRIEYFINRLKGDNLKPVIKALFGSRGPVKALQKKFIRNFNGYDFDENSDQWEKRKTLLAKLKSKELKVVCETLDLERSGTVVALTDRIMEFCKKPADSGKKPPKSKRKSKGDGKSPRTKRSKGAKTKRGSKKSKDASDSVSEDDSDDEKKAEEPTQAGSEAKKSMKESSADENDSDSGKETEDDVKDNESEDEEKKEDVEEEEVKNKKTKKSAPMKAPAKPAKKAPAKRAPPKKKQAAESEDEDEEKASSSEDDEPLVKIAKSQSPPTDDDIKTYVKKILEGANLEEITMKTVCKQVYEHYPEHDLAHKKDLIKETVKSLIST